MRPPAELSSRYSKLLLLALAVAGPAFALQPLGEFLQGARASNVDQAAAALTVTQQEGESMAALGRTLPSFSARGTYTRNQFESKIDASQFLPPGSPGGGGDSALVITPLNQLDAYLQVDAPILDASAWARLSAQHASERAARQKAAATLLDVQKQVARSYYQLLGAEALRQSAQRSLEAAQANLELTRTRRAGGVATDLDVNRATAEVERSRQSISDADLTAELSRRALQTLTGVAPAGEATASEDDLHEEPPLEAFVQQAGSAVPAVAAAAEQRKSAEAASLAAQLAWVPSVSASASEHLTNATGLTGRNSLYMLTGNLRWQLDLTTFGTLKSQSAAAELARAREQGARQAALDALHEAWFRVHNGIAKGRAARAAAVSAQAAVARARERSLQGAGTQLELIQAERDAFTAEVSRVQADADLSYARAALRLQAGHPLDEESTR
ncbi:MAG TPA: TolC family protein [Myxococcales bacterium]|nr:TolC family protein [Myxococcales bacterium]